MRPRRRWNLPIMATNSFRHVTRWKSSIATGSRIHGDLHAGNIYVAAGSSDVILIDFYKTYFGPCLLDLACFEVDIVFNRGGPVSHGLALQLYKLPLQLPSLHAPVPAQKVWLLDTIRAIRRFALTDPDHRGYVFGLACYLIRYASFGSCGTGKSRAVAACIASHLIKSLQNEKEKS